jgi:P4 family phage/plasmid primase-like protien
MALAYGIIKKQETMEEKAITEIEYQKIVKEVIRKIDKVRVAEIPDMKRSAERVDRLQELLREAVLESSIGYFNGKLYAFTGHIYKPLQKGNNGREVFGRMIDDIAHLFLLLGDFSRVEAITRVCLRVLANKTIHPDPTLIMFRNGVYHVNEGVLTGFRKKFVQVTQNDFDYEPKSQAPNWHKFLDDVLPETAIQNVLQEFLGSIFIDRKEAKMEQMLILKGAGGNGKSVIFEVIKGLLGEDNISTFAIGELISGAERKRNIASMNGKRLNYCSEIQTNSFEGNTDTLKAVISGEPMEARLLYCNNFTAYNIPLLMANANKLPAIKDWSNGMRRRLVIIPFDVVIPEGEQKKDLATQLAKEYSGIFNWVFEGRKRFIANGYKLTEVPRLAELAEGYISESTNILKFMAACNYHRSMSDEFSLIYHLQARELYFRYAAWCTKNHFYQESEVKFSRVLTENGFMRKKTEKGSEYCVYVKERDEKSEKIKAKEAAKRYKNAHKDARDTGIIRGITDFASFCKMPVNIINRVLDNGGLEGCYSFDGRTRVFDAYGAKDQLVKYLASEKRAIEKAKEEREEEVPMRLLAERRRFNQKMKKAGEPFRKPLRVFPNQGPGVILVNDNFNFKLHKNKFQEYLIER